MIATRFLWPILMVIALIATGLIMKYYADRRKRRGKGAKQHPRLKDLT